MSIGDAAFELMREIFPYPRSLTGSGVRATFDAIERHIPLTRTDLATGTQVFDWQVPNEWNIRDAYVATADGTRVIDFREHSLHVVGYSEPVRATLPLENLRERLFTLPDQPELIPYRTSYYSRTWGFCLPHHRLLELEDGDYEVVIDSTLGPGNLTFAECEIPGRTSDEVLFSTYVCHPSLANDNLSGIAVATMLARELAGRERHFTYRFLFAPGTIGPLSWLHCNQDRLDRVVHGLAVSCIGDAGDHTYKRSRRGDADIDRAVTTVLRDRGAPHTVLDWDPWGGDERQFCSPGFNLPMGCLMRTPHGGFDGYHTSADSLDRISPAALEASVLTCLDVIEVLESNRTLVNLSPYGEPQLGKRGLFRAAGGAVASPDDEKALLWILNLADGEHSLLDIAGRSGIAYSVIRRAATRLEEAELLAPANSPAPLAPH
jgi:aminopeptidase-like protein